MFRNEKRSIVSTFSDLGSQVPVSGLEFRVSGSGFQVSGVRFRVLGSGFRVSDLGFRVSGFGGSDFGFRVRPLTKQTSSRRQLSSEREQMFLLETPDLYHRSPDSGDRQYKPRGLEKAIRTSQDSAILP